MTDCSVYVGLLTDRRFKWVGGDWNGNVPRSISPDFPPAREHYNRVFHAWVKRSGVECKQTDFGGWVAKVTKAQIDDYVRFSYEGQEDLSWVAHGLPKLQAWLSELDAKTVYALVATEF
ncbi:hypothetical protein ACET9H_11370 [Aeromonas media]|uniref:hypothetical protein n=1 Tax=Aeromonas media TaxID=651 RepID=UPI0038D065CF